MPNVGHQISAKQKLRRSPAWFVKMRRDVQIALGLSVDKNISTFFLKGAAMPDIQKSMKLSLAFGLSGAVILPVLYEVYANISAAVGLVLIAVWAACAGAKFSALKFKEAFMGMVCTLAYAGILGVICYIVIHPKVSDMLNRRSVYFQLSLKQQAYFVLYAVLISLCMFLVWGGIFGVKKAIERFRLNREKTGEYIDKAFDDDEDML